MGEGSFYDHNWEPNMDQGDPFDSALTSIVSSPAAPSIALHRDNSMIREVIGRLGTICNCGDASFGGSSATTSCYTTPLNSPLKHGLSMVERNSWSQLGYPPSHLPLPTDNGQVPLLSGMNSARKRKFVPRGKAKKSSTTSSANGIEDFGGNEQPGKKSSKDDNVKPSEPMKDYIHVRARRGQATDSHSLAERVRREKISLKMKVLQGLVPGCNKVTGKAVMLNEIINYVQLLQRQVEFLSMKLTTLNPRMDFNFEAFVSKEMSNPLGSSFFPADSSSSGFPYSYHPHQVMHLHGALSNMENQMNALNVAVHTSMDGFCKASSSGVSGSWEDELHSIVQMGIPPNQPPPQRLQGSIATGQMKIEL